MNLFIKTKGIKMKIRLLNPADAKSYWNLRLEALKEYPEAFLTSYEEVIKVENPIEETAERLNAEGSFTFGAFENHELIGIVTLVQEKALNIQHRANIFAMYVTSNKQGQGVAKALLTEAINKAKSIDSIEKINLSVEANNEAAKKLYTQVGFKVYGVEEKALKMNGTYFDDEHMVLHIK
jgi:RimJ/RimL family protein N-acetyltransferase